MNIKILTDGPVTPERSQLMSRVGQRNTRPELVVRRLAHILGYRFRLHRDDLPGRPDIAFPSRRKVVLVHGCFWHRHQGCTKTTTPKTRRDFWQCKFLANVARDKRNIRELRKLGWKTLVIWECETTKLKRLQTKLQRFLDGK